MQQSTCEREDFPSSPWHHLFFVLGSKDQEGLGSRSPRIFLLQPPVQGLLLKGPNPHGEGGKLRDDGDVAKVGRGGGCSEVSRSPLQPMVGIPELWSAPGFGEGWRVRGCGQCSLDLGEAGTLVHPWGRRAYCAFSEQLAPGSRTGCLEFLSPWSLDLLTFPASEEAVYSQKVIHSLIRSTSLLTGILTSCPGGGKGGDSSTLSPVKSV